MLQEEVRHIGRALRMGTFALLMLMLPFSMRAWRDNPLVTLPYWLLCAGVVLMWCRVHREFGWLGIEVGIGSILLATGVYQLGTAAMGSWIFFSYAVVLIGYSIFGNSQLVAAVVCFISLVASTDFVPTSSPLASVSLVSVASVVQVAAGRRGWHLLSLACFAAFAFASPFLPKGATFWLVWVNGLCAVFVLAPKIARLVLRSRTS